MKIHGYRPIEFFLSHGILAVLCTWPYEKKEGKVISVKLGPLLKVGARVEKVIVDPSEEDLRKYLSISGFQTVEEWKRSAVEHCGRASRRLVIIRLYAPKQLVENIPGPKTVEHDLEREYEEELENLFLESEFDCGNCGPWCPFWMGEGKCKLENEEEEV